MASAATAPRTFHGKTRPARDRWDPWCRLESLPWWTVADAAELDTLTRALIRGIYWHLDRCPIAKAQEQEMGFAWCRHLSAAVEEVVEWRDLRESYSRACWLRKTLT